MNLIDAILDPPPADMLSHIEDEPTNGNETVGLAGVFSGMPDK